MSANVTVDEPMNVSIMATELKSVSIVDDKEAVTIADLHSCNLCSFETENKKELALHLEKGIHQISGEEQYFCEDCDLVLSTSADFNLHIREIHTKAIAPAPSGALIPCHFCDFHASTELVLKDHLSSSQTSEQSQNMQISQIVSTEVKCECCSFSTSDLDTLTKHKQDIHKPIQCKFCNFSSTDQLLFETHMREVHTSKPAIKCVKCHFFSF